MDNKEYTKRMEKRKLDTFSEYTVMSFSAGVTALLCAIMFFTGFDVIKKQINMIPVVLFAIYLAEFIAFAAVMKRLKKEITCLNAISSGSRILGILLIAFILTGNIFGLISGFILLKKDKSFEYTLSVYMLVVAISIFMVSFLNLFKEYVADTFILGMGLLMLLIVFYLFTMYFVSKHVSKGKVDKKLMPISVILMISSISGNVFALILGLVLFTKIKKSDSEVSIEWIDILRRLFRNSTAVIGLLFVSFLLSVSLCSLLTFDYSIAVDNNYDALLAAPCLEYPFGTDNYGRCVFTRIIFGARISLLVGFAVTAFPIVLGGVLGAVAGFYGNKADNIIMRLLDILIAIPDILLAIAIIAAFGVSTFNLILALSVYSIPSYARTVRANVMSISNTEFVEAARACGAKDYTIIFRHIIPNSLAPVIVKATLQIGGAVLSTSSLSYLGLGVEPHIPEWGNILKIGSNYLETNPYIALFPGVAIILLVLSFNFFGDGLRDALDPKLK